jgi:hypothetical protein
MFFSMEQIKRLSTYLTTRSTYSKRFLSWTVLILVPWILLFIITSLISHHTVTILTPCWNDEMSYWHEVLSFSTKGFHFGYYTMNEMTPKFLSFGTHGFGTTLIYTVYAKIFGWNYNSIVMANTVFLSISFLFLVIYLKPTTRKTLLISIFYLTYTPLILYCSTSMSELMNFSLLIDYVILLYAYIKSGGKKNKLFYILIVFCSIISFIRIIYIILFLPVILYKKSGLKSKREIIILLICWIFLSILLFLASTLFVSPFPNSFLSLLFSISNLFDFIVYFVKHFVLNVMRFIYPFRDDFIQVFQRYILILSITWLVIKSRVLRFRYKQIEPLYFNSFLLISLSLIITFAAYDVFKWRDYRVIAPLIFGIILLHILSDRLVAVKCFLLINILGILFLCLSTNVSGSFFFDSKRYTNPVTNVVLNKIIYSENVKSRFDNTLIVDDFDENVFLKTPAGIGITHVDTISDKLKSKYIYTNKFLKLNTYKLISSSKDCFLYQKIDSDIFKTSISKYNLTLCFYFIF